MEAVAITEVVPADDAPEIAAQDAVQEQAPLIEEPLADAPAVDAPITDIHVADGLMTVSTVDQEVQDDDDVIIVKVTRTSITSPVRARTTPRVPGAPIKHKKTKPRISYAIPQAYLDHPLVTRKDWENAGYHVIPTPGNYARKRRENFGIPSKLSKFEIV